VLTDGDHLLTACPSQEPDVSLSTKISAIIGVPEGEPEGSWRKPAPNTRSGRFCHTAHAHALWPLRQAERAALRRRDAQWSVVLRRLQRAVVVPVVASNTGGVKSGAGVVLGLLRKR
jgi:hypothetical protein